MPLLDYVIETAKRDLKKISKKESFLNNNFPQFAEQITGSTKRRQQLMTELRTLAERNKTSLGELDRVEEDLAQVNSRVEELVEGSSERG